MIISRLPRLVFCKRRQFGESKKNSTLCSSPSSVHDRNQHDLFISSTHFAKFQNSMKMIELTQLRELMSLITLRDLEHKDGL